MDWQLAITRNREALLQIVIALMASVGLCAGGTLTTLPYFLYRKALRILRQAESAVRRLIVIAAHDQSLRGMKLLKQQVSAANFVRLNALPASRMPTFNLIDPLKTFGQDATDLSPIFVDNFVAADNSPVPAASLALRLLALKHALDSIPKLAKRLARWYEGRDLALRQNHPHRYSPIRPGPPPASRRRDHSEMGLVLRECHSLAIYARDQHDSS